jgi:hypothetical protein
MNPGRAGRLQPHDRLPAYLWSGLVWNGMGGITDLFRFGTPGKET